MVPNKLQGILLKLVLIIIVYGVHSGPPSSEFGDHRAQHPHYPELALRTHQAIGETAA